MGLARRLTTWPNLRNHAAWPVFWSTIWLAYLIIPLFAIWTSGLPSIAQLAMTALLVFFAACYVTFWILSATCRLGSRVPYAAGFLLLVALAGACVGSRYGLGYTLVYAGAAVAMAAAPRFRLAVAALVAVACLAFVIGVLSRLDLWSDVLEGMLVLSSGAGVLAYVALHIQNDRLSAAREEIARLAVAEERLRFSRDLHDLLGHSLSVIVLKAELAHRMAERSPERTAQEVGDIERVAREALREVRDAVAGYRQPSLSQELDGAAETLRETGVQVLVAGGPGTLPGPLDAALAWTVREATTNVIRHAQARRVRFDFAREDQGVRLRVTNDGAPAAADGDASGNGLRGLRERLRALGGNLTYGPGEVDGFTLSAWLPLASEAAPAPAALA
jgi:two-component system, NarL family, sensor histidine kinase DesK